MDLIKKYKIEQKNKKKNEILHGHFTAILEARLKVERTLNLFRKILNKGESTK